jgi:hypothetical protein
MSPFRLIPFLLIAALVFVDEGVYGQEAADPNMGIPQFFDALNLDYPGMEAVKRAIEKKDFSSAAAAYLEFRRERSKARYLVDSSDKPAQATGSVSDQLERIRKSIWGSFIFKVIENNLQETNNSPKQEIDWYYNPKSPKDPNFSVEIELCTNRQLWWKSLADAYWSTLDERYTREWISEFTGWIRRCPADPHMTIETSEQSSSWRPLEVGIRMHETWPYSYYHFIKSPEFTPNAHLQFVISCLEQGRFLNRITVDNPNRTGNHVTTECIGLATVACLFPEWKESESFAETAKNRLTRELSRQVYPDGAQIELTPWYHNVVLEAFTDYATILSLNGRTIPAGIDKTLHAMNRYYVKIMDQQGRIPSFNDSAPFDGRPLLRAPAQRWNDPEFEFIASGGKKGKAPALSSYLPYAGFYTMRSDWGANGLYACFRAGPAGAGHWHEDKLQFVINAFGQPLVIDPGRYTYDQSIWRYYVIGTSSHNTITVDGKEQKRGGDDYGENPREVKNPWMVNPKFDFVSSSYDSGYREAKYVQKGYQPITYIGAADKSITHTRYFFFIKPGYFVAVDLLTGAGTHRYESHFNLEAPDATIDSDKKSVRTNRPDAAQIALYSLDSDGLDIRKAVGEENPVLGWSLQSPEERRPIPTIVYTKQQAAPASFATLFYPFQGNMPAVTSSPLTVTSSSAWAKHIETPTDALELIIHAEKSVDRISSTIIKPFSTDASVTVVRHLKGEERAWLGIYNSTGASSPDFSFTLDQPGNVLVGIDAQTAKTSTPKMTGLSFFNPGTETITIHITKPLERTVTVPANDFRDVK